MSKGGKVEKKEFTMGTDGRWHDPAGPMGRPGNCPDCGMALDEPRSRMPRRARAMGLGWAFYTFALLILADVFLDRLLASFSSGQLTAIGLLVYVLPMVVLGKLIRQAGRVIPMECFGCGWKKDFRIHESRKYDLKDGRHSL
jgi:hypothetical protein